MFFKTQSLLPIREEAFYRKVLEFVVLVRDSSRLYHRGVRPLAIPFAHNDRIDRWARGELDTGQGRMIEPFGPMLCSQSVSVFQGSPFDPCLGSRP